MIQHPICTQISSLMTAANTHEGCIFNTKHFIFILIRSFSDTLDHLVIASLYLAFDERTRGDYDVNSLSDCLFESDGALHLQRSFIPPAPNHLEWELCRVYNVWVCMPLQQQQPEPETPPPHPTPAVLLYFFRCQLCWKKSPRSLLHCLTFKVWRCGGVFPSIGGADE